MDTMHFSDPDKFDEVAPAHITKGDSGAVSEYIGELIRAGQKEKARAVLEAEILKGIESGPAEPMTDEDWANIRAEVLQRCEERRAQGNSSC